MVEPAHLGLGLEDHRVEHQPPGQVGVGCVLSRVYSCSVRMVAVRWVCTTARTSTPGVVSASASLMASSSRGRSARLDRGGEPERQLGPARVGDLVRPLPPVVLRQRAHQAVAFQPGEGGVDLPDVQRPGAAGGLLELGPQLVAVAGAAFEQGEQTVPDGHSY